jgi:hypothetical protein
MARMTLAMIDLVAIYTRWYVRPSQAQIGDRFGPDRTTVRLVRGIGCVVPETGCGFWAGTGPATGDHRGAVPVGEGGDERAWHGSSPTRGRDHPASTGATKDQSGKAGQTGSFYS